MARIGIDLDGVTYKFVDQLRSYIHKKTQKPLSEMPPAMMWDFFSHQWGFTTSEYIGFVKQGIIDCDIFWYGDMYEDAKKVLEYIHFIRGDDIIFITARKFKGVENLCKYATQYWINNIAGLPYTEIIVTDSKVGYDLDVLFDDAPHIIEDMILHGENVVIFDQPWNMHLVEYPRVYGWNGLLAYLEEKFPTYRNINATSLS